MTDTTTFTTEGARRLAKLCKAANGVTRWAKLHGFAQPVVSRWCNGTRLPSTEMAVRLQTEVGIPVETWTIAPQEDR